MAEKPYIDGDMDSMRSFIDAVCNHAYVADMMLEKAIEREDVLRGLLEHARLCDVRDPVECYLCKQVALKAKPSAAATASSTPTPPT